MPNNTKFCPKCGQSVEASFFADDEKTVAYDYNKDYHQRASDYNSQPSYDQQPQYQKRGYQEPQYHQSAPVVINNTPQYEPVSVGGWIGVFFLTLIPLVNLIMMLVWAFGGTSKQSLKNYARASFLMVLIAVLITLIGYLVAIALGIKVFDL